MKINITCKFYPSIGRPIIMYGNRIGNGLMKVEVTGPVVYRADMIEDKWVPFR